MDGFLNVLKPSGVTSHDVVQLVRKLSGEAKIGHLGTLDPLACGVLPLALGRYTRLAEYFLGEDKEYLAEFTFGISTDSGDTDGKITVVRDASFLTPDDVSNLIPAFTGKIVQSPPAYSAVKVRGRKLYELARKGLKVKSPPREVTVFKLQLARWLPGHQPRGLFRLHVSGGTYVRSIAIAMGEVLGTGAAVSYLLRIRSGRFDLAHSLTLNQIKSWMESGRSSRILCETSMVLPDMPRFVLSPEGTKKARLGVPLSTYDFLEPAEVLRWTSQAVEPEPVLQDNACHQRKAKRSVAFALARFDQELKVAAIVTPADRHSLRYEKVLL